MKATTKAANVQGTKAAKESKQGKASKAQSQFKQALTRWQFLKANKGKLGFCIDTVLAYGSTLQLTDKENATLRAWKKSDKELRANLKPNAKTGNFNAYQVFMYCAKVSTK